ncbi:hypothetical protein [Labrys sp. KNU-23]|uniref:hypothetical protein n=1 Tax=Labrys sp. KNU-23 TaxID=2789216 RepID=UPI00165BAB29|nr:hypothetical protein [Labrys sp. KNU-23]
MSVSHFLQKGMMNDLTFDRWTNNFEDRALSCRQMCQAKRELTISACRLLKSGGQ